MHQTLKPHTVLAGALLAIEQTYWTDHAIIPKENNNPFSVSSGWLPETGHVWAKYGSVIEAAAAWKNLITGVTFSPITTVPEFVHKWSPSDDGNDEARIVRRIFEYRDAFKAMAGEEPVEGRPIDFTKGIPLPPYTVRLITNKPQGVGWNNLGKRSVLGEVLHRMQGTLWGTDSYFRLPTTEGLTDFGIDAITGEMLQWTDPYGNITPWASGPVKSPYGDGLAFVNRFKAQGLDVVNKMLVSLEFSGYFRQPGTNITADTPLAPLAIRRAAQFIAHFAQMQKVPWHDFPIVPAWGTSSVFWHQEFTLGSGKICPGDIIMAATPEMIAQAREFLRMAQSGVVAVEPVVPGIAYPMGLDKSLATTLFGTLKQDGKTYTFDEAGPVSIAWLTEGSKDGEFGKLVEILTVNSKPYYRFDDGLVLYQPTDKGAYRALGVGNPTPASVDIPK